MFDERSDHYRRLAARLRAMAQHTRFADLRSGYLELAAQFERLAVRGETRAADLTCAVRVEAVPVSGCYRRSDS